jgi:hypothetical protein
MEGIFSSIHTHLIAVLSSSPATPQEKSQGFKTSQQRERGLYDDDLQAGSIEAVKKVLSWPP